mmetsp:Transcript_27169/g.58227  ORF Transcript_27169/g.58227 Transcript_27169/m.58227 type:complete len:154 (+) Transcript_27169:442-903(+)
MQRYIQGLRQSSSQSQNNNQSQVIMSNNMEIVHNQMKAGYLPAKSSLVNKGDVNGSSLGGSSQPQSPRGKIRNSKEDDLTSPNFDHFFNQQQQQKQQQQHCERSEIDYFQKAMTLRSLLRSSNCHHHLHPCRRRHPRHRHHHPPHLHLQQAAP